MTASEFNFGYDALNFEFFIILKNILPRIVLIYANGHFSKALKIRKLFKK
jgi:hypothetical protein